MQRKNKLNLSNVHELAKTITKHTNISMNNTRYDKRLF